MKPIVVAMLVVAVNWAPFGTQGESDPAARFRSYRKQYSAVAGGFRKAENDQQRKTAVERLDEFPRKFLDLADKHAGDPIALSAIQQAVQSVISVDSLAQHAWEMNRTAFPAGNRDNSAGRAVMLLLRDHAGSDRLGLVCERMRYGVRREYEQFLSTVLRTTPHTNVRALSRLALGQLLKNHLHMLELVEDRPELADRYEFIFGKGFLQGIRDPGRAALSERIESLFEQAAKYDDVNIPVTGGTVGHKAKAELYDLQHLSIGKTSPEIEGHDQDGVPFKLSDYRGKVVLLYFWVEF